MLALKARKRTITNSMEPGNLEDDFNAIVGHDEGHDYEVLNPEMREEVLALERWIQEHIITDPLDPIVGQLSQDTIQELTIKLEELDARFCPYVGRDVAVSGIFARKYLVNGEKVLVSGINLERRIVISHGFAHVINPEGKHEVVRAFIDREDSPHNWLDDEGYFFHSMQPFFISRIDDPLYVQYDDRGSSEGVYTRLHTEIPGIMNDIDNIFIDPSSALEIAARLSSVDISSLSLARNPIRTDFLLYVQNRISEYFSYNPTVLNAVVSDAETGEEYEDRMIGSVEGLAVRDVDSRSSLILCFAVGQSREVSRVVLPKFVYVDLDKITAWEDINEVMNRITSGTV